MSDIVERLRASKFMAWKEGGTENYVFGPTSLESEAANEIERMRRRTEQLESVLGRLLTSIHVFNSGNSIAEAKELLPWYR